MPSTPLHIEAARALCLALPHITEEQPFGPDYLVYKLQGKVVALIMLVPNRDGHMGLNLKCAPDYALSLREAYHGITPAYHMNKRHWNTLWFGQDVSVALAEALILHSAQCVIAQMPAKWRALLAEDYA